MKCEYCGRTNHDDGHGGCFSCGAPVTVAPYTSLDAVTCSSSYYDFTRQPISRKKVEVYPFMHPALPYEKDR